MQANWSKLTSAGFLPRSSHGVAVHENILYLFGGEHKARHAINTDLLALDLQASSPEWKVVETKGNLYMFLLRELC